MTLHSDGKIILHYDFLLGISFQVFNIPGRTHFVITTTARVEINNDNYGKKFFNTNKTKLEML